jgi:hypothetical protein
MTLLELVLASSLLIFLSSVLTNVMQKRWPGYDPTERRLALLERKINALCEHLGIEQNQPLDKVQDEIVMGRKINAIKLYREQTGVGLREAKEAVESMEAQMKAQGIV